MIALFKLLALAFGAVIGVLMARKLFPRPAPLPGEDDFAGAATSADFAAALGESQFDLTGPAEQNFALDFPTYEIRARIAAAQHAGHAGDPYRDLIGYY